MASIGLERRAHHEFLRLGIQVQTSDLGGQCFPLGYNVGMARKALTLQQQVGQLLIIGFDGTSMSAKLRSELATVQPGGVILFRRNIEEARQTYDLVKEARTSVPTPMFHCIDLEGGTVDRFRDMIAPAPAAEHVYATGSKKIYREHGRLLGEECSALGFNTDFAPVSDLGFEISKKVMTTRTVSADPKKTVEYVREFLRGLSDAKVLGCGKHFPGLGEATLDTHHELPSLDKSWDRLWREDLMPYRELHKQFPFVMVAHAAYPAVTKDKTPASISRKWITDILRKKIGYNGLIMADDLEMGGVQAAASVPDAAIATIAAGSDIFLICHNDDHVWGSFNAVVREAEKSKAFRKLVETAAERVMKFKSKSPEVKKKFPSAPTEKTVAKLRQKIWSFEEQIRLATL
jgi:beta-N-acetylhexosaminidase